MLEIVKQLRAIKSDRRGSASRESDSSAGSEGSVGDGHNKSKSFKGLHRHLKSVRKRPKRTVHQFLDFARSELGVTSASQHWQLSELAVKYKPLFGQMIGMFRVYYELLDVIENLCRGNTDLATAQGVQLSKAILQVALDKGSWANGAVVGNNRLARQSFGSTERELEYVYAYWKALKKLRSQKTLLRQGALSTLREELEEVDAEVDPKGTGKKAALKKKKWEAKKKAEQAPPDA